MIIHSLKAKNFLKYQLLVLDQVPEQGIIGISGQNESGKSSIGETICFALFGRTFSVADEDSRKLIHWGENSSSVEVELSFESEQRYLIKRYLDRDGNHSASIQRRDEDEPFARGAERVADSVYDLLGYQFEDFIESFYLAQREISAPHPQSESVKHMAGIAPLELVTGEYREQCAREAAEIEDLREKQAETEAQIEQMALDSALLPELTSRLEAEQGAQDHLEGLMERGRSAVDRYLDGYRQRRELIGQGRFASFLRLLVLLLFGGVAGSWLLLSQMPDAPQTRALAEWVKAQSGIAPSESLQFLLYASAAVFVLLMLVWARCARLQKALRRLQGLGEPLQAFLQDAREWLQGASVAEAPVSPTEDTTDAEDAAQDVLPAVFNDDLPQLTPALLQAIGAGQALPVEVQGQVDEWQARLQEQQRLIGLRLEQLREESGAERVRVDRVCQLREMNDGYLQQMDEHRYRIRVRELAVELLIGASRELSSRFNHNLKGLVGSTLPLFTEDRYEHLMIDQDLRVKVFSSEKRDFMGLDEISSGTQRQIMLALRLALSQELINRAVKGAQFVFLDEPFAFFDEQRTANTLKVLPELSSQIKQIWVVAQHFPENAAFDYRVNCQRESNSLRI